MTIDFFGGGRVEAIFVYGWFLVKIQGRIELNFVHGWVFNHRVSLGMELKRFCLGVIFWLIFKLS